MAPDDAVLAEDAIGSAVEDLDVTVDQFSQDVLSRFAEIRGHEERLLSAVTGAGYWLYALGWSVALFLRLCGVGPPGEG
jgi:hypothetical protein